MKEVILFITNSLYDAIMVTDKMILWTTNTGRDITLYQLIIGFLALSIIVKIMKVSDKND